MALKKKPSQKEAEVQKNEEAVAEAKAAAEEKNVTKAESEAIVSQQESEKEAGASTKKLEKATALVSGKFNLDDSYSVTNFKDGGKSLDLTLENKDFVLSVKIKDSARHGLVFDE